MRRAVIALATLALLLPAGTAHGAASFRGVTEQSRPITFPVDELGRAQAVVVQWRARCRGGTRLTPQETTFAPPEGGGTAGAFAGVGTYRFPEAGGRIALARLRIGGRMAGDRTRPETQTWTGTLRATVRVRRHTRIVDRCALRTRWRAKGEGFGTGRWAMTSDQGDWVGGGQPWTFDASNSTMVAMITVRSARIDVQVDPAGAPRWSAYFQTENARAPLQVGKRYVIEGPEGDMDVSGDGRGCGGATGHFVLETMRRDALGRLMELKVSFEQHCHGEPPASRGTIEWRATN